MSAAADRAYERLRDVAPARPTWGHPPDLWPTYILDLTDIVNDRRQVVCHVLERHRGQWRVVGICTLPIDDLAYAQERSTP